LRGRGDRDSTTQDAPEERIYPEIDQKANRRSILLKIVGYQLEFVTKVSVEEYSRCGGI
jgi:hypothetical protein